MLVISSDLVLATPAGVNLENPLIGYENILTASTINATTEAAGFPASNLANPSTALKWKSLGSPPVAYEYLTITTNRVDPIDYVAVARHNWGSENIPVSIGYFDEDDEWVELTPEVILADDDPVLFRFLPQSINILKIRLNRVEAIAQAAVVYCGKLLVMERGLDMTPHTPLDYGKQASVVDGMSESGEFLGRIVVGGYSESIADFKHLTPSWYREFFDPFAVASKVQPFFFAWKPEEYPREVGYAWLTASPKPAVDHATGRMAVSLAMRGIA